MDEILAQLGELIIGSLPTALLFLVLVVAFHFLLQKPLTLMFAERRNRTTGAVEKAHEAIVAADAKAQEYESKLRHARMEILKAREARVQHWNAERDKALEGARKEAHDRVLAAKDQLEG